MTSASSYFEVGDMSTSVIRGYSETGKGIRRPATFSATRDEHTGTMGVMNKLRRLLGLVEGHENQVAEQVSKRTSVSEEKAKEGINKAQEAVNKDSSENTEDRSHH